VHEVAVSRHGSEVWIDIEANAFVYHMVRNIAGALIAVGDGRREPTWIEQVLALRDRTQAGITAPPDGLTFMYPTYPDYPHLPIREDVTFQYPAAPSKEADPS
jgi:tRNA pseudouridine38-40 synthase